ncbi:MULTISPECIES: IucA/IucC family protein [Dickeya]|uniref:Achromobactin synthetase component n=1 Tax=Dickeya aquatica TaxID=1401087 RepID=A0A375A8T0_9GAMM|nr:MULTISPECIES: IucA/IucC family protein [Dickeya]SLM62484.1 achromobactin synthetase component [Dickeya aquatica]
METFSAPLIPSDTQDDACDWLTQQEARAERYRRVEQRVVGQLLQTLLYEAVVPWQSLPQAGGNHQFILRGVDARQAAVEYRCLGRINDSFSLIRLDYASLRRCDARGEESQPTLHLLLAELLGEQQDNPFLARFVQELEQTQLKDLQARTQHYQPAGPAHQLGFDALERHFMDAHSYHPCYKSRIGFSLQDNRQFGPEFATPIALVWLALAKNRASANHSTSLNLEDFLLAECGPAQVQAFSEQLAQQGRQIDDYWLVPVHPWQWRQVIVPVFYPELACGELIYLGLSQASYQAQQSIRTLANVADTSRPYVKLALSITNTSSTRILARHTVMNGPIITDWLHALIDTDQTARNLKMVILREVAGVSFDTQALLPTRMAQAYGTFGALWRENIHTYLQAGEQAVPFNGLSHVEHGDNSGTPTPFIDHWVRQYGLEAWTRQLLVVTVTPIIHMLYAEGIGMESHGQNIILIARDGWPERIALKDFHDGVRYSPDHLARPAMRPDLVPLPASHAKINRNSFILTEDVNAVRDFTCDAFFFICLAEMAIFLRQHYALPEAQFWQMTAEVVLDYQAAHPQHRSRYALFDVFAPTYEVEELTKRRLLGDGERRFKAVPNPLYPFRPASC